MYVELNFSDLPEIYRFQKKRDKNQLNMKVVLKCLHELSSLAHSITYKNCIC